MDDEKRSALSWIFILTIGIFFGNVFSFASEEIYQMWKLKQWMFATEKALNNINIPKDNKFKGFTENKRSFDNTLDCSNPNTTKVLCKKKSNLNSLKKKSHEYQMTNEEIEAMIRQDKVQARLNKTCEFWHKEYANDPTDSHYNRYKIACARARGEIFR